MYFRLCDVLYQMVQVLFLTSVLCTQRQSINYINFVEIFVGVIFFSSLRHILYAENIAWFFFYHNITYKLFFSLKIQFIVGVMKADLHSGLLVKCDFDGMVNQKIKKIVKKIVSTDDSSGVLSLQAFDSIHLTKPPT